MDCMQDQYDRSEGFELELQQLGWQKGQLIILSNTRPLSTSSLEKQWKIRNTLKDNQPQITKFSFRGGKLEGIVRFLALEKYSLKNLISLNVKDNLISSIEGIDRIDMPQLKQIIVDENMIRTVSPLRKGFWPNLHTISLNSNFVVDLRRLSELKTVPKMYWVSFDVHLLSFREIRSKIEGNQQKRMLSSLKQILQAQDSMLHQKFPTINLLTL